MNTWQDRALIWGGRDAMAEVVDRTSSHAKPVSPLGNNTSIGFAKPPMDYAHVFRLGRETIPLSELNWQRFSNTVKENYQKFWRELKMRSPEQQFFRHVTARGVLREAVWANDINPIKELFSDNPDKKLGAGIFRLFAFGMLATDILKNTEQAYQKAKTKEDGSLGSKLHTWKETLLTAGKFTLRNLLSWGIGSVAFAFGRALLSIALGGIPVFGIAIGALGSLLAQELVLDKVLGISKHGTPKKPVANPFKNATI